MNPKLMIQTMPNNWMMIFFMINLYNLMMMIKLKKKYFKKKMNFKTKL